MGTTWDWGREKGRRTATHSWLMFSSEKEKGKLKDLLPEEQRSQELIPSHAAPPETLRLQTMPVPSLDRWASQEADPEHLQFVVWCFKAQWNSWPFILKFQAAKHRAVGASYEHLKCLCIRTGAGHFKSTRWLSSLLVSWSLQGEWRTRRSLVTGRSKNSCFNNGRVCFNCETR